MILVDFSGIAISTILTQTTNISNGDGELLRHILLNTLRSFRKKFYHDYGELVICCDAKNVWRKTFFPFYKANRKKSREDSTLDWDFIYETINQFKKELKEFFPYKVIEVDGAEADDVIAVLAKEYKDQEKMLIVSNDKDFFQLHKKEQIVQYMPFQKKIVENESPDEYLFEHIIRGDVGDGVPNILSDDDCLVDKEKRQSPVRTKYLDQWKVSGLDKENKKIFLNYDRNKTLIDFSQIPENVYTNILEEERSINNFPMRKDLLPYFQEHNLKKLVENLGDF